MHRVPRQKCKSSAVPRTRVLEQPLSIPRNLMFATMCNNRIAPYNNRSSPRTTFLYCQGMSPNMLCQSYAQDVCYRRGSVLSVPVTVTNFPIWRLLMAWSSQSRIFITKDRILDKLVRWISCKWACTTSFRLFISRMLRFNPEKRKTSAFQDLLYYVRKNCLTAATTNAIL